MNITTVLGGPRKNGNTAAILGMLESELQALGHKTSRINLDDYDVKPCLACLACQKAEELPGCIRKDDANLVFKMLAESDAIVLSTPLYMWTYAAQMKAFLDRSICCVQGFMSNEHRSIFDGKRLAFIVACAGPLDNNADMMPKLIQRWTWFAKTDSDGLVEVYTNLIDPHGFDKSIKNRVAQLAERLTSS